MNKNNIDNLITDKYFDIYNRSGFEYIVKRKKYNEYKIYLLDFDDVKKMNTEMGYIAVNDLFKKTFSSLKEDYIIGRAFSGDEIFLLTKNINDSIDKITKICNTNGLYFKCIESTNNKELALDIFLEKMIENFR